VTTADCWAVRSADPTAASTVECSAGSPAASTAATPADWLVARSADPTAVSTVG